MRDIVLATGNKGKVKELQALLADSGYRVFPQTEFKVPEADETGLTFVENALIKARNAAQHTGKAAIADDSGLVVDALAGAPGIYSARYAGPNATDLGNNRALLSALATVPGATRSARFHCAIVFLRSALDPIPIVCQASWEGTVLNEARGEHGFGYDPLFYVDSHQCTSAQLPADIKNQISHRGQALKQLLLALKQSKTGTRT